MLYYIIKLYTHTMHREESIYFVRTWRELDKKMYIKARENRQEKDNARIKIKIKITSGARVLWVRRRWCAAIIAGCPNFTSRARRMGRDEEGEGGAWGGPEPGTVRAGGVVGSGRVLGEGGHVGVHAHTARMGRRRRGHMRRRAWARASRARVPGHLRTILRQEQVSAGGIYGRN